MSRITLISKTSRHHVVVGWDRTMGSFFAEVADLLFDEEDPRHDVLWIGTDAFGCFPEPGPVIEAVRPYALVPPDLERRLLDDRSRAFARVEATVEGLHYPA